MTTSNSTPSDSTVAQIIADQLGGLGGLQLMLGARDFLYSDNSLQFRVGSNAKRIQRVVVQLDASDTYTVTASRFDRRKLECVTIDEASGVYCDQLVATVEKILGMVVRLPRIVRR